MNKEIKNLALASALSGIFAGITVDTVSATEMKEKWELNRNEIMTVGKYFNNNNDYINSMKVCKKHEKYVEEYHFNPISDTSLFTKLTNPVNNIKGTQHFYNNADVANMLPGLYGYVYEHTENGFPARIINGNLQINHIVDSHFVHERNEVMCGTFRKLKGFTGVEFAVENVSKLTDEMFANTDLQNIVVPESVEIIGEKCFYNCNQLGNVVFPTTLKRIHRNALQNTNIKQVIFPSALECIGEMCFLGCDQLVKIQVPGSIFMRMFRINAERFADRLDLPAVEQMNLDLKQLLEKNMVEITLSDIPVPLTTNDENVKNRLFVDAVKAQLCVWFGIPNREIGYYSHTRKALKNIASIIIK